MTGNANKTQVRRARKAIIWALVVVAAVVLIFVPLPYPPSDPASDSQWGSISIADLIRLGLGALFGR